MTRAAAPPPPPRPLVSSSPGRPPEKLSTAPGLSRLLRGKSGGRSRGRSSLLFVSRSRSMGPSAAAAAHGEPSSPKVSCIGQVRIRSNKQRNRSKKLRATEYRQQQQQQLRTMRCRCRCLLRVLLCKIYSRRPGAAERPHRPPWRWWRLCCWLKQRKEADVPFQPPAVAAARESISDLDIDGEEESKEDEMETRGFVPSPRVTTTPPKNALLLMRCRSAPHNRSSSLALSRFAAVPGQPESFLDEIDDGSFYNTVEDEVVVPVVLKRCKSEPASTAAMKLVIPEEVVQNSNGGSRRRRLDMVEEEQGPPPLPAMLLRRTP